MQKKSAVIPARSRDVSIPIKAIEFLAKVIFGNPVTVERGVTGGDGGGTVSPAQDGGPGLPIE